MFKSQLSDLHWSVSIVPRDRVRREYGEISFVRSLIDVSNSHMTLPIVVVITPQMTS